MIIYNYINSQNTKGGYDSQKKNRCQINQPKLLNQTTFGIRSFEIYPCSNFLPYDALLLTIFTKQCAKASSHTHLQATVFILVEILYLLVISSTLSSTSVITFYFVL